MKDKRRDLAIGLRLKGKSIKSIALELHAAQSSVSMWVRNVRLTETQTMQLKSNMHTPEVIEKRRQARLKSEFAKRAIVIEAAQKQIQYISKRELWLIGIGLYWVEGSKTKSVVQFSNGDPRMILVMLRFFKEVCAVEESRLRAHIHIHEHLDVIAAEEYWQQITGIQKEHFYKTYNKPNISSKGTRNSLPYGVCDIYVSSGANLLLQIKGWTNGIYESALR